MRHLLHSVGATGYSRSPSGAGDPSLWITEYVKVECEWPPDRIDFEKAFDALAVQLLQDLQGRSREVTMEGVEALVRSTP